MNQKPAGGGQVDVNRGIVIAVALAIAAGGILADVLGLHRWGSESDQFVTASGALFWISSAALIVSAYDTLAAFVHGLPRFRAVARVDQLQTWGQRYHLWLGLLAILVGALFGHFFWSPS